MTHETLIEQSTKHPMLQRMHDWSFVSGLSANDEATRAVFVVTTMDRERNTYDQYLWQLLEDEVKPLTALGQEGQFQWESEHALTFAANRTEQEKKRAEEGFIETNFYRLPLDGGEAMPFLTLPIQTSSLYPLGDQRFLCSASVRPEDGATWELDDEARRDLFKRHQDKAWRKEIEHIPFYFNGRGFVDHARSRLFFVDARDPKLRPLTDEAFDLSLAWLSDDKREALLIGQRWTAKQAFTEGVWHLNTETLECRCLNEDTGLSIREAFKHQGRILLFASDMKRTGLNQDASIWTLNDAGEPELLDPIELHLGNSVGSDSTYGANRSFSTKNGRVMTLWTERSQANLVEMNNNLGFETILAHPGAITGFAQLKDQLYVTALHAMKPAELYRVDPQDGTLIPISHFNDHLFEQNPPIHPVRLDVESPEGDGLIDGFVLLPPGFDAKRAASYPAILDIHGGPKTVYGEVYVHEMQLWAYEGYVVMFCNPHGSDGRGDAFSDIRGCYGGKDYNDLMAFTDAVLEHYPAIDPERLGVTGGSYGGFMTNWIITHTDRFKAAATQRSISNWLSFYGVSDIGYYFATDQNHTQIAQGDHFHTLWDHSPMKYIDQAQTPTLFIHSDEDYRCPIEQAYQFFVGLQDRHISSKIVIFHGENHELSRGGKPQAREERLAQITDWMNHYLL